jgi:hypothetical protein
VDADDRVRRVVLATEEFLKLGRLDFLLPLVEVRGEIVGDVLAFVGPVDERRDLFLTVAELFDELEIRRQTATVAGELFAPGGIGPNLGVRELAF